MQSTSLQFTTPSRRAALRSGIAALTAGIAAPALAATSRVSDPVVALYRQHQALEATIVPLERRSRDLRADLAARYGDVMPDRPVSVFWGLDYDYPELIRLNDESDRLNNEQCLLVERMLVTPATTPAGAAAKLTVALDMWRCINRADMDFHESATLDLMEDAVRVLTAQALS